MRKKKILAAILVILVLVACATIKAKQVNDLQVYARNNNCVWTATGTNYGDDRDFICK